MAVEAMTFYVLELFHRLEASRFSTKFLPSDPFVTGNEAPKCPECHGYIGLLPWLPPYRVTLEAWGAAFGDIVSGPSSDFLISDRFRRLVDDARITGLTGFDEVEVKRTRRHVRFRERPPVYYRVTVQATRCRVDQLASRLERSTSAICPACCLDHNLLRYERVILKQETWEGHDLFKALGLVGIINASQRLVDLCRAHDIRNAVFVPGDSEAAGDDTYPHRNARRAQELLARPLSDALIEKRLIDGGVARYYTLTNEAVIQYGDGRIEMDRPVSGREFWERLQ